DELPALGQVHHAARRDAGQPVQRAAEHPGMAGPEVPPQAALQLQPDQVHGARASSSAAASSSKPSPSRAAVTKRGGAGSSSITSSTLATPTDSGTAANIGASLIESPTYATFGDRAPPAIFSSRRTNRSEVVSLSKGPIQQLTCTDERAL